MKDGKTASGNNRKGTLFFLLFLIVALFPAGNEGIGPALASDAASYTVASDGKGSVLRIDVSRSEGRSTAIPAAVIDPDSVQAYRRLIPAPAGSDFPAADTDGTGAPRTDFLSDDRAGKDAKHDGSSYVSARRAAALAVEIRDRLRRPRGMSVRDRSAAVVEIVGTALSREGIR